MPGPAGACLHTMHLSPRTIAKGVGVYFAAAVSGYLYLRSTKAPAPSPCGCGASRPAANAAGDGSGGWDEAPASPAGGQQTFDRLADRYDSCINVDETFMGVKLMRRWLMRRAEGDVLEVSAGTGRNLPYYDLRRLRSLTLTDTSRHMLVNAADKYAEMGASTGSARVRFELADAQHLAATPDSSSGSSESSSRAHAAAGAAQQPPEARQPQEQMQGAVGAPHRPQLRQQQTFPPRSFDCVVDTFGLCSQQDPVTALKEMARVCKPGGRILLLQHGKGTWGFVNSILDSGAGEHYLKWGCWWNRDIERIVRQAGLRVDSMSRWHFGTTYLVVARPAEEA
ncbi:hypothetical protein CHLNCDRAFT_137827 [Chlorella variabilis]|uniref:Methyltransferase type 11 domain-containing protein n=1 Tax=Chlorella variabilis TaxID=554065 RepID=E1Z4L1_CHLVA|nr:hypothetical protein CHLNCDRAFT_137827 [Chlorella variabilis]EFN59364.1 hypothetical protein CHLNCDRAFT_137827 [Chlorella variabilis]|eukprot:XP_005851466.1 hypothetical protein CHLNCDRAFT_137827 [Chlorella variabilis]